ncbi:hypothetical protein [Bradyrhizobium canariense]|uniref:Uncharacterized protein n=1 Tax=Bradyrhizobium canariense TaxID=255045 RepID=A0A1X3HGM4_9BRAD|nr:hypothetical protein [Bradyrhizobium canariense]OSI79524.1 hypothetical protein BSZ22_01730 [Bradyrhizobium canariense]OSI82400.1 hypothetical protein BSZ23_01675 [Bradyrhizobium canariense]OSI96806.1 hypothetical protein BSZ25_01355 [Bradyrhizobium canariense]OSI98822.1 hypothetical protein BSZ24_01280 [Bradyrhizobium canariense]OSJ16098.1 hypothetical protein BSZ16_01375 [Bradyrhizobium canariense]
MDKQEFIELAPSYYYAATAIALSLEDGFFSIESLKNHYTLRENDGELEYLSYDVLIKSALRTMMGKGGIIEIADRFGPSLFQKTTVFDDVIIRPLDTTDGPYIKNKTANNYNGWIRAALQSVNTSWFELSISNKDFEQPPVDEWAPITIDQNEATIRAAVEHLDKATTAIERDNGYAVTHAQERDQVVRDLKGGLEKLKTDTISVGLVRRILTALKTAGVRFANTLTGQAIDGALLAFKEVVKKHANSALELLWALLPPW